MGGAGDGSKGLRSDACFPKVTHGWEFLLQVCLLASADVHLGVKEGEREWRPTELEADLQGPGPPLRWSLPQETTYTLQPFASFALSKQCLALSLDWSTGKAGR